MGNGCKKPDLLTSNKDDSDFDCLSSSKKERDFDPGPMELMAQAKKIIQERKVQQMHSVQIQNKSSGSKLLPIYKQLHSYDRTEINMTENTTRKSSIVHTHEQSAQTDQHEIEIGLKTHNNDELPNSGCNVPNTNIDEDRRALQIQGKSNQQHVMLNTAESDAILDELSSNTASLVNRWVNSNRECATGMPPIILQKYVSRFGGSDEKKLSRNSLAREDQVALMNKPAKHVHVQTDDSEFAYYEDPQCVARPPLSTKAQILQGDGRDFQFIDQHISETPKDAKTTLQHIVALVNSFAKNDFLRVRAYYKWISRNIRYNWRFTDITMSAEQVLQSRVGASKDYCTIFAEFCRLSGIRCQTVHGFAKDGHFRPGYEFQSGQNCTHTWNVVFLNSSWRFVDCTWGTGYLDSNGKFFRRLCDHFFLTDPSQFIWTHFPYDAVDRNYSRWQLMDRPITLQDFNSRPKVTAKFFEYHLKIRQFLQCPIVFEYRVEIMIESPQAMQYLIKVYANEDTLEDKTLKRHVFCTLKEDRLLATFRFTPPMEGNFLLKIYAHPEATMSQETALHDVVTFSLSCTRIIKGTPMLPIKDFPWGPNKLFYDLGLKLVNNNNGILHTIAGRKTLVLEKTQPLTVSYKLMTAEGVTLDPKLCLAYEEKGNLLRFIIRPHLDGFFKFAIFAMPNNKKRPKGPATVPCVATFLVDCPVSYASANEIRYAAVPAAIEALEKRANKQNMKTTKGKGATGARNAATKNSTRKNPPRKPKK